MQDLTKIDASQLRSFMKHFTIALGIVALTLILSRVLPFYFAPIIGLLAAMAIYTMLYNHRNRHSMSCALLPYSIFYCLISYSFVIIILNMLRIFGVIQLPRELSFFHAPFVASLILDPVTFITLLVIYIRGQKMSVCVDCKISKGTALERGKLGEILTSESHRQLKNLVFLFGVLTLIEWGYYLTIYSDVNMSDRDWYVFLWLNLIAYTLDGIYFGMRYYNIFLDLQENGEIISEEEVEDMTVKTYLRYYVICGNHIYVNAHTVNANPNSGIMEREVIDTPFLTKRNVNGISQPEVKSIIERLTGVKDGELRFFFGRRMSDLKNHRVVRYMYFLDGDVTNYDNIPMPGEWMDFEMIKVIYTTNPGLLARVFISDISRMTTIVLTQKIFNENGYRKIKTKSYQPTYSLQEVRNNRYDFQDDKWIRISMFNSDRKGYGMRRWLRNLFGGTARNVWERDQLQ